MNRNYTSHRTHFPAALALAMLAAGSARAEEQKRTDPVPYTIGADTTKRRTVALHEALELTARQSPDVAVARAQAAIVEAGISKAYNAWRPDVSAGVQFDHTSAPSTLAFGPIVSAIAAALGFPPPSQDKLDALPNTTIVAANSWYGNAYISQPLFSPQGAFLPGIAKQYAEAADHGANDAREQILLGSARAYLALQGTAALLKAAQDAERVSLKREEDAKAQIAAGTAVELNLSRAQAETAAARVQIAAIEGSRQSLYPLLEGLVGEAVEPVEATLQSELPTSMSAVTSEPWEASFAVRSAISQVKAVEKTVSYDTWQWLPTVVGIAKGNYNSNDGFAGKNFTYDLILAANIPLYDRGARYSQRKEDLARLQETVANLAAQRARVRSNWLGARANVGAAEAALSQAIAQDALAIKVQQQVDASSKAGLATSLDLVDADNRRYQASSNVVQARTTLEVRRAELLSIEGKLYEVFGSGAPRQ